MTQYTGLLDGSTKSSDLGFVCSMLLKSGYCSTSISRKIGVDIEAIEKLAKDGIKHGVYPTQDKKFDSELTINRFSIDPCEFAASHIFQAMKFKKIDFVEKRISSQKYLKLPFSEQKAMILSYGEEENFPGEFQQKIISIPFEEQKRAIVSTCMTNVQLKAGFYVRQQVWMSIVELCFVYLTPWEWSFNSDSADPESIFEEVAIYHKKPKPLCVDDFIDSKCLIGPQYHSTPVSVFDSYCDWCEQNGVEKTTIHGLGRILKSRIESLSVIRTQVNQKRTKSYIGIGLK